MSHSQCIILRSILKMGKIIFEKLLNILIIIIDLIVIRVIKKQDSKVKNRKLILDFELLLEVYQNEIEELETRESSENDLSFTQDSILEGVKRALGKINKYFTD